MLGRSAEIRAIKERYLRWRTYGNAPNEEARRALQMMSDLEFDELTERLLKNDLPFLLAELEEPIED